MVQEYSETNDIDYVLIDGGSPPRAAFGQSFVQLLYILFHLGLLEDGFKQYLQDAIALLDADQEAIQKSAREIAQKLNGKIR